MLIHCKHCNSKFAINAEEVGFEGRLVKCEHCEKEWFQESKSQILEKKLIELDRNLHATELHLIEKKNNHNNKIRKLEKALKLKKEELIKQRLLENRVKLFEKRIIETEKEIESQTLIENRIAKLENEIKKNEFDSFVKNNNLDKKTSELQNKVKSEDIINKLNVLEKLEKEVKERTDEVNNKNLNLEDKAEKLEKRLQSYSVSDRLDELEKDISITRHENNIIENGKQENGKSNKHPFFSPNTEIEINNKKNNPKQSSKFSFWSKKDTKPDTGELVKEYFKKKKTDSPNKKLPFDNVYETKDWDLSPETLERELKQIKTTKNK